MPITIEPRIVPMLIGHLPPSFEEQVDGRMIYHQEGDNFLIYKDSLLEAEEDFKETELYQALHQAFEEFPAAYQILLQPV